MQGPDSVSFPFLQLTQEGKALKTVSSVFSFHEQTLCNKQVVQGLLQVSPSKRLGVIKGGAQSETNYQRTLRRNQLPSGSWYKAFPGLTAVDMARNHRIRQGLDKPLTSAADIQNWLQLL